MKKLVLSALLSFFLLGVNAQEGFKSFSLVGGPALTHVMGGDSWNPAFGFMLGAETDAFEISENSALSLGLNFTMQGANYEESYNTDYSFSALKSAAAETYDFSGSVTLSYLYVPILYVNRSPNGFYFEAGVQPGFLVAAKDKYDGESMDYKDYINGFEIGGVAGVGYAINDQLLVNGRLVYGLTDINKETDDMYASEDKDHNLFVGLIVHWLLPTK